MQPQWSDGGESIAAEEEGPGLIVFLRINIINVIQQSVLDEGATTPLGKIHSTSLIGQLPSIGRRDPLPVICSCHGCSRFASSREFSVAVGERRGRLTRGGNIA